MHRRLAVVLLALSLLLCCGCSSETLQHQELTLHLPKDFVDLSGESYAADYDFLYQNSTVAVAGIRESREALAVLGRELTAREYAALLMHLHKLPGQPEQKDGIWYFSYEAVSAGISMTYICAVYDCSECFWSVQAYCASASYPEQQTSMWNYLSSVTIDG